MNFKRFHESKNLFDMSDFSLLRVTSTAYRYGTSLGVLPQGTYTFNATKSEGAQSIYLTVKLNGVYSQTTISSVPFSFTADGDSEYIIRTANNTGTTWEAEKYSDMMLNTGSQPLPYEPYSSEVWHDTPHYIMGTSTDTITTPADIYANDTIATVGLKGQMSQTGTPTPTNPIQPSECGERTANLFDKYGNYFVGINSNNYTITGLKPNTQYTCSTNFIKTVSIASIYFGGGSSDTNGVWKNSPNTKTSTAEGTILLSLRFRSDIGAPAVYDDVIAGTIWVMVNEGSTALPYEPYGYFIEIEVS